MKRHKRWCEFSIRKPVKQCVVPEGLCRTRVKDRRAPRPMGWLMQPIRALTRRGQSNPFRRGVVVAREDVLPWINLRTCRRGPFSSPSSTEPILAPHPSLGLRKEDGASEKANPILKRQNRKWEQQKERFPTASLIFFPFPQENIQQSASSIL